MKPGLLAFLVAQWIQHKAHIMFHVKSCQPVGLGHLMLSQCQAHFTSILQAAQDSAQRKHLPDQKRLQGSDRDWVKRGLQCLYILHVRVDLYLVEDVHFGKVLRHFLLVLQDDIAPHWTHECAVSVKNESCSCCRLSSVCNHVAGQICPPNHSGSSGHPHLKSHRKLPTLWHSRHCQSLVDAACGCQIRSSMGGSNTNFQSWMYELRYWQPHDIHSETFFDHF